MTFTPSAGGPRTASVSISDDASGNPHTLGLSGTGAAAAPAVSLSPATLDFGAQRVGTTGGVSSSTLTNSGSAPLTIGIIGLTGANQGDFVQGNDCPISPAVLDVGASCTISVRFSPTATGSRSAGISITDDAPNSPHGLPLTGTGTAPAVSITPTTLSFGSRLLGTTSPAQTSTLTNTGGAPLLIASIVLTGANPGDYGQSSACPIAPATLSAGASCTVAVTFSPAAGGSRTASVSISDDAAGSPHTIALTGTGSTGGSIAFDRSLGTKSENVANNKMTLTTSGAAAPNARVFLFVSWHHGSRTLTSVSGGGLTWTVDVQAKDTTNYRAGIASASAPAGLPAGTAITATFSGSVTHGLVAGASFTGIAPSAALDGTSGGSQAGVTGWTRTVTTTNANDLVLGWSGIDRNTTSTPAAPNTEIHDFGNAAFGEWATSVYRIESTAGQKTVSGTWLSASGATANITVAAAYRSG